MPYFFIKGTWKRPKSCSHI